MPKIDDVEREIGEAIATVLANIARRIALAAPAGAGGAKGAAGNNLLFVKKPKNTTPILRLNYSYPASTSCLE
jgi:hypothetical protein